MHGFGGERCDREFIPNENRDFNVFMPLLNLIVSEPLAEKVMNAHPELSISMEPVTQAFNQPLETYSKKVERLIGKDDWNWRVVKAFPKTAPRRNYFRIESTFFGTPKCCVEVEDPDYPGYLRTIGLPPEHLLKGGVLPKTTDGIFVFDGLVSILKPHLDRGHWTLYDVSAHQTH